MERGKEGTCAAAADGLPSGMSSESPGPAKPIGRMVAPEALAVAPAVLGRPLAEPWRRFAAMAVDVVVVGLLSLLAKPFLALGTGALLIVLLGNNSQAPLALKVFRWICRGLGVGVIGLAVLAIGHSSLLRSSGLRLEALTGQAPSAALKETVFVPANASYADLRRATEELQDQVDALKQEYAEQQAAGVSWLHRARALSGALGVTFGWSGIYFTLLAGLWQGRTLGKFLLRTQAVKINGSALTFFDAFIRHGGYIAGIAMGMIGFLKLLWEPNRQTVEDRIAGTVVVNTTGSLGG